MQSCFTKAAAAAFTQIAAAKLHNNTLANRQEAGIKEISMADTASTQMVKAAVTYRVPPVV